MPQKCENCHRTLQFEEADYEAGTARMTCENCGVEYFLERGRFGRWRVVRAKRLKQEKQEK